MFYLDETQLRIRLDLGILCLHSAYTYDEAWLYRVPSGAVRIRNYKDAIAKKDMTHTSVSTGIPARAEPIAR